MKVYPIDYNILNLFSIIVYLCCKRIQSRQRLAEKHIYMQEMRKSVVPIIESVYDTLTESEKMLLIFYR